MACPAPVSAHRPAPKLIRPGRTSRRATPVPAAAFELAVRAVAAKVRPDRRSITANYMFFIIPLCISISLRMRLMWADIADCISCVLHSGMPDKS